MTNEIKKYICIGVIVTKKISLYDGKHAKLHFSPRSGKHLKKQFNLSVWMRFFRKISQNREIEDKTADDLNILICHLPKKKDGSAYEPTALASFACCLHSRKKKKVLFTSLGQSLLEQTMKPCPWSSVLKTTGTVSSNIDLSVCE